MVERPELRRVHKKDEKYVSVVGTRHTRNVPGRDISEMMKTRERGGTRNGFNPTGLGGNVPPTSQRPIMDNGQ